MIAGELTVYECQRRHETVVVMLSTGNPLACIPCHVGACDRVAFQTDAKRRANKGPLRNAKLGWLQPKPEDIDMLARNQGEREFARRGVLFGYDELEVMVRAIRERLLRGGMALVPVEAKGTERCT